MSRVQKFIFHLGFKSLQFKSSFGTWGSKVRSSKVCCSKVHICLGVQKSRVQKLGVQKFRVQKSGVQKFILHLEFNSLEFKSESSSVWGSNVPESFFAWAMQVFFS